MLDELCFTFMFSALLSIVDFNVQAMVLKAILMCTCQNHT